MNWRWVVVALILGGLAAAWWFTLQWHQENRMHEVPQQGEGQILLMVEHNGPELELHWDTQESNVESASSATLTITDGSHESQLSLDQAELRSGVADYWPRADRVTFHLQTDDGAWGSLKVPAWERQPEEPVKETPAKHEAGRTQRHHGLAESDRADERGARTVHAKHKRHTPARIPSYWKMPSDQ